MERDYSLLRPFDMEAAKAGAMCCWGADRRLKYIGPSTRDTAECFQWVDGSLAGRFETYQTEDVRMAPLAWVEGRPVYEGDVLYSSFFRGEFVVTGTDGQGQFKAGELSDNHATRFCSCSWTAPASGRQVALLAYLSSAGYLMWRDVTSGKPAGCRRVPSEDKTVEVQS